MKVWDVPERKEKLRLAVKALSDVIISECPECQSKQDALDKLKDVVDPALAALNSIDAWDEIDLVARFA